VEIGLKTLKTSFGRETALDPKVKDELVKRFTYSEDCVLGLNVSDVGRLAFQIADESFKLCSLCSQNSLKAEVKSPLPWLSNEPPVSESDI
jgi:hypothetical protein